MKASFRLTMSLRLYDTTVWLHFKNASVVDSVAAPYRSVEAQV